MSVPSGLPLASTWSLTIKGMVDREITLTYDDLLARDLIEVPITMLVGMRSR